MNKYIVLSVNDNPDYLWFVPLCGWAWKKIGWKPIIFCNGNCGIASPLILNVKDHRSDTITQVSRLYASAIQKDGYLMTGDIDMIPLSDYWKHDPDRISVYGHDLTGHTHYPICYIGMQAQKWREVMNIDSEDYNSLIKRDLDANTNAKSDDFYKYWFVDQEIATERLKRFKREIDFMNRGQYPNGFAYGRVDRGAWSLNHKEFIDAHLFQQVYHKGREQYFDKILELLARIWPEEDFSWLVDFNNEFKKLTGHA